jgi:transaldolase
VKGEYDMRTNTPGTKIFVDGGDPDETMRMKNLIGFVDGQTTNPSLIAKNPAVQQLLRSGRGLSAEEQTEEYRTFLHS